MKIELQPKTIYLNACDNGVSKISLLEEEFYSIEGNIIVYCDIYAKRFDKITPATHESPAESEDGELNLVIINIEAIDYESGEPIAIDNNEQLEEIINVLTII